MWRIKNKARNNHFNDRIIDKLISHAEKDDRTKERENQRVRGYRMVFIYRILKKGK